MISIGSGVKGRASQRRRNNCLTLEMENGAPANCLLSARPPTLVCPGAGGWRAISRLKNEPQHHTGDSFAHRSFHALPETIRGSDGKAAGAILGFANFLLRF
jgi:hypothetical protein